MIQIFLDDYYDMDQIQYLIYMKNKMNQILHSCLNLKYNHEFMNDKNVDFKDIKSIEREISLKEICEKYNNE